MTDSVDRERRRSSLLVGSLLAFVVIGVAQLAAAQPPGADERARTHFNAGLLHYEEGAYDRALAEFERAYELSARALLLLNLATVKERLGMHTQAADDLRAYLEAEPEAPERERLERRIGNLERLAEGQAPAAVPVEAEPSTGAEAQVEPPQEELPPPASAGLDEGLLSGAIASYAVGAAGIVVMAVLGSMALAEDSALASGCGATSSCSAAEVADADTFALVSDVGLGIGAAGLAVGTALLVAALTSGSEAADRAGVAPWIAADGAGLIARGRF